MNMNIIFLFYFIDKTKVSKKKTIEKNSQKDKTENQK